jgi:hypothetical protein
MILLKKIKKFVYLKHFLILIFIIQQIFFLYLILNINRTSCKKGYICDKCKNEYKSCLQKKLKKIISFGLYGDHPFYVNGKPSK